MNYTSTRGNKEMITPSMAIIKGISNDGGLYVPTHFPNLENILQHLIKLSYKDLALFILEEFLTDFTKEELQECINKAYDDKFSCENITPIKKVNHEYFLELYHGPTCAFKDIALTLLPHLMTLALKKNNLNKDVVILTATSGDTGKAALEGFKNVAGTKIIVFFPNEGVSPIQKLQMQSQEGNNTFVVSIEGNFDDAQSAVKEVFGDDITADKLNKNNYILSSANSINIGRLIPQIVYYFHSYFDLVNKKEINLHDKINFCVPTGNFGDILAGYYAMKMGLPINKLICSSNENNVLYDFFKTGIYDKNRILKLTTSPSMDILISSNLERLLYDISSQNTTKVNELVSNLNSNGMYEINDYMRENLNTFYSEYATENEIEKSIKNVFNCNNYLMDTHTSVAYTCYQKYKNETKDNTKTVILSTASPYKFSNDVLKSLDIINIGNDTFSSLDKLSKATNTSIPAPINNLKHAKVIHSSICNKVDIKEEINKILKV